MRSCTSEALALAKAVLNGQSEGLKGLFDKAIERHDELLALAHIGKGCDRHLMAVQIAAEEIGIEIPQMFKDEAFKKR